MTKKTLNIIQFVAGIILALTGATFMFFGILPLGTRITISIIGLALIAISKIRLFK